MEAYTPSMITNIASQSAAFRFVALLAGEVSSGQVELPAFPDVVARVKNALSNDQVTPVMIAKVVASEAGLAARLMTLANSAIMNPSGTPITELRTAVVRIGYNNVRASSVAYAIGKLRQAEELKAISKQLEQLWKEAVGTASLCYVLARRMPNLNADEALLTGLVHNIGKVYLLSRSHRINESKFTDADIAIIIRDWHANVGKAIIENWKFAPQIAAAIGDYEDAGREIRQPDLGDVLTVANRLYPYLDQPPTDRILPEDLVRNGACLRLGFNMIGLQQNLRDGAVALNDLRSALGA